MAEEGEIVGAEMLAREDEGYQVCTVSKQSYVNMIQ